MKYRKMGRTSVQVSALGFGCMRLPTKATREEVDEAEATRMIRYAIEQGVNYFDSGYNYHGGNSERVLGRALQEGRRQHVLIATKLWGPAAHEYADFDRLLNEQLARLQTDHLDFYLLHGLRKERWEALRDLGVLDWLPQAKADGRIRFAGFSFHDSLAAFQEIVDAFDWDMCQIQYNYMNETYQAGTEGLRYAAAKGMGVVVMEPLLGGRLVSPPEEVARIWQQAPIQRSAAEWALAWLWNQPEVSVALSGMSAMQQVVENVASADRSSVGMLSDQDLALVAQARDQYNLLCPVPCTACRYCMPCPNGVDIPGVFSIFNNGVMYNQFEQARREYTRMPEERRASACIQCRECEDKCPQSILISQWMPLVHAVLGEGQTYDPRLCPTF